jgi:hypothetical protein
VVDDVGVVQPERREVLQKWCSFGIDSRTSATSGQRSSTASPIAYSVCCRASEWVLAKVSSIVVRTASNVASQSRSVPV